jgi:ankyrin repeat protein
MFALLGLETEAKIWLSISPLHRFLKDNRGYTPFQLALFAGHVDLVSLFLSIPNFQTGAREEQSESLIDLSSRSSSMETPSLSVSREKDLIDINGCITV